MRNGEVWKGRDTRLDRIVALRFSKAQFSDRFEFEACAIAALNHPNIARTRRTKPENPESKCLRRTEAQAALIRPMRAPTTAAVP
jgi:hypothetical protein